MVFDILSPGNRVMEMLKKEQFYDRYGVAEYYIYDPDDNARVGWRREAGQWHRINEGHGWISPLLGVRFELPIVTLVMYRPDGRRFKRLPNWCNVRKPSARRKKLPWRSRSGRPPTSGAPHWSGCNGSVTRPAVRRPELAGLCRAACLAWSVGASAAMPGRGIGSCAAVAR